MYICFVLDEEHKLQPREWGKNEVVKTYSNEENLLKTFLKYYLKIKPTIITGWNIDGFDIPYLYNRIYNILGEDMAQLSITYKSHLLQSVQRKIHDSWCELFGLSGHYIKTLHSVPNQVIVWMILVNQRLVPRLSMKEH